MNAVLLACLCGISASADYSRAVVVPDFTAPAWQGRGLAVLVSTALNDAAVHPSKTLHAQRLEGGMPEDGWSREQLTAIGRATSARAVLAGDLMRAADGLRIECVLLDTSEDEIIGEATFGAADLPDAANKLLAWLRKSAPGVGAAGLPTDSVEALRSYCRYLGLEASGDATNADARLEALEMAVAADGSFYQAVEALARELAGREEYDRSMALLAELGRAEGFTGRAQLLKGRISERKGRLKQARRRYRLVLESGSLRAEALYRLARLAQREGDIDRAGELCRDALAADAFCARAADLLGTINARRKNYPEAVEWLNRAIAADPLWDRPHDNLAIVLYDLGEMRAAQEHLVEAIRLNPANARCHRRLAIILAGSAHYAAAIRHGEKAVELRPRDVTCLQTLGAVYYQAKETSNARKTLEDALAIEPDDPATLYTLGLTWKLDGDIEKAISNFRHALRIEPNLAECRADLERAKRELKTRERRAARAFSCARTQDGSGPPMAFLMLLPACILPALWSKAKNRRRRNVCPLH